MACFLRHCVCVVAYVGMLLFTLHSVCFLMRILLLTCTCWCLLLIVFSCELYFYEHMRCHAYIINSHCAEVIYCLKHVCCLNLMSVYNVVYCLPCGYLKCPESAPHVKSGRFGFFRREPVYLLLVFCCHCIVIICNCDTIFTYNIAFLCWKFS